MRRMGRMEEMEEDEEAEEDEDMEDDEQGEEDEEMEEEEQQQHLPTPEGPVYNTCASTSRRLKVPSAVVSKAEDLPAAVTPFEVAVYWLSFSTGCKERRLT